MPSSIIIADDHPLFRQALRETVAPIFRESSIVELESLAETRDKLKHEAAELLLLDLRMPDSDGLAGLISATAFAAYGAVAILQGQVFLSRFCFTLVGAVFGFLWFNVHPAALFMGDTGSLSLGATLAVIALMAGQWVILPVIAVIPFSEAVSVILQVGYFKLTKKMYGEGRRIFRMTPLHLHFELLGWSETQIVQRFWLIGLLMAMAGVGLAMV